MPRSGEQDERVADEEGYLLDNRQAEAGQRFDTLPVRVLRLGHDSGHGEDRENLVDDVAAPEKRGTSCG
jgi:hypothetical protein